MKKEAVVKHVDLLLSGDMDEVESGLGISFKGWSEAKNIFNYIPMLYKLQKDFHNKGIKSFIVIPRCSARARHIFISNTVLSDLLIAAFGPKHYSHKKVMEDSRAIWSEFFDVQRFETSCSERKRFYAIKTDEVSASVIMTRKPKDITEKIEDVTVDSFTCMIGIDPGRRLTVGGIRVEATVETMIKIPSWRYRHWTKEYVRRQKPSTWSGALEAEIRERRESMDNILQSGTSR